MSDALETFLVGPAGVFEHGIVGIMGGHQVSRDSPEFREVARLGYLLTQAGFLVLTGGGPGAMEAGNLGAFLAPHRPEALDRAIEMLRDEPHAGPPVPAGYFARAQEVIRTFAPNEAHAWGYRHVRDGGAGMSLAIPTWTYGH